MAHSLDNHKAAHATYLDAQDADDLLCVLEWAWTKADGDFADRLDDLHARLNVHHASCLSAGDRHDS